MITQQPTKSALIRGVAKYVRVFLRAQRPVPDIIRRYGVRRAARSLVICDPWPGMNATGADAAQLALLRLLHLQRETHLAVRHRATEAATMLARASIETLFTGLYCLYEPNAVAQLHEASVRQMQPMLEFLADAGLMTPAILAQCIAGLGLGKGVKGPGPEEMARAIDKAMGGDTAIGIYKRLYRPTSNFAVHAGAGSLMRHVRGDEHVSDRPWRTWLRRAPVRVVDFSLGALTSAVAKKAGKPYGKAAEYADKHGDRIMPPITVIGAGTGLGRVLARREIVNTVKLVRQLDSYARAGDGGDPAGHVARIRGVLVQILMPAVPGMPQPAADPFLDHLAATIASG